MRDAEPKPLLVIAPRHPERGPAIAELAAASGLRVAREQAGQSIDDADILVADRLGELGLWFRLARLAIMGGSLLPGFGGHNREPARLGTPFVFGPHVDNWAGVYDGLMEAGATSCASGADELANSMRQALIGTMFEMVRASHEATVFVEAGDAAARTIPAQVLALIP